MKTKIAIGIALIIVVIGYILGFIGKPFLFIVFFPVILLALSALAILVIFLPLVGLIRSLIKSQKKIILLAGAIAIGLLVLIIAVREYRIVPKISSFEALKSLPYLSYVPQDRDVKKDGVVIYNESLANKGINIFNFCGASGAFLVDMSGKVLHKWTPQKVHPNWHHVELCNNSDLLVVAENIGLVRLDRNANVKWARNMLAHHDIAIAENGDIYVLGRKDELVFSFGLPIPIVNDYIVVFSPNGRVKKVISLFKMLKREISLDKIFRIYQWIIKPENLKKMVKQKRAGRFILPPYSTPPDIFHINTIELINEDINDVFKKGHIIFCSRMLDLIGVMDIRKEKLLWSWGAGNLDRPHHPTLLENGHILIFDNGSRREYSRIIELDPFAEKIVWQYKASPPSSFFSCLRGGNQRLPNGNTLITESDRGHVFEVTKDGEIVWEFYNPVKTNDGRRLTIYRMMRITDPQDYSFPGYTGQQ